MSKQSFLADQGPGATLAAIRDTGPLVQNITNFVAMDLAANLLLSVGASPAMAHAGEEVEEFVTLASALTINTGTFTSDWLEAAVAAAAQAVATGTPWVLDPVGCGATKFRLANASRLAKMRPTIIRGNASEIAALSGASAQDSGGKGVDSTLAADAVLEQARRLALNSGAVVAVTGEVDLVTDGDAVLRVANGHMLLTRVTAAGCALTALTGAAAAVCKDPMRAARDALVIMGVAGERAAAVARGPGSFRVALLDALYNLESAQLDEEARLP
ncbi:hydroxyethylthiazole kinase [Aquibaculum arenosum]|uniref:Hydroxyethylthiazole kinase n=1 Tax=Aquibaculum arenosum TaxID=3032591 RepID=A0ABT5YNJ6_9PROT|nr:hydroxyethylthiazole kinase [Fodinicurvata sp. CAU 1616]MDF2096393.1 hydroxyethylthiazole kinase [Fodinicurvata sp. CAU 1616]